ncbi:MAG TPA: TetR/AcrR family transcriptional regulator [Acidimicrobiales bacterium]|nr:TetR/AcrR family transcriptional regulator [Acidimicrobiales bacterium]
MSGDPRQTLLDAAIDYVADNGLTDLSLRSLAAELGTSHRMLIHHFGSKEALWVAIVQAVEARERAGLAGLLPDPELPFDEQMRAWWRHISHKSLWPNERLFFEIYAQALRGGPTAHFLDDIVDAWVEPIAAASGSAAFARLCVAVTRGLLLDLLATQDRKAVDAAMDYFIARVQPSVR